MEQSIIIQLGFPPFRINILTGIDGVDFEIAYHTRRQDVWGGVPVYVIDLAHLKKSKEATGRKMDLADLEELPPA